MAGICHEIGLIEAIDLVIGPSGCKVSCGAAVQAMVLNGLGFTSRALYLMPQYLDNKPVDLLVYSLAERKLRLKLAETGSTMLNQVSQLTQTIRWIFQVFEGIDLLIVSQDGRVVTRRVLNLKQEHLPVLRLLGPPVEKFFILGLKGAECGLITNTARIFIARKHTR